MGKKVRPHNIIVAGGEMMKDKIVYDKKEEVSSLGVIMGENTTKNVVYIALSVPFIRGFIIEVELLEKKLRQEHAFLNINIVWPFLSLIFFPPLSPLLPALNWNMNLFSSCCLVSTLLYSFCLFSLKCLPFYLVISSLVAMITALACRSDAISPFTPETGFNGGMI